MDNVFVISMIFAYFAVPRIYQHRVLFWGILGVIVLRAVMIGLGAALVMKFTWVMYFFAVVLVATGIKMIVMMDHKPDIANNPVLRFLKSRMRVTTELHGQSFLVRLPDPKTSRLALWATPLFLCLILVEVADLVFAIDSVPAIFAITPDLFIVYTSNIFAILGLRALYFALAAMVHRFHYLKYALALVLIFIGSKIFLGDVFWDGKMPASLSLSVTLALLLGGVIFSLWKTSGSKDAAVGTVSQGLPTLRVKDIKVRESVHLLAGATVGEASALMATTGSGALPVLDQSGKLLGIVTEGDLLRPADLGGGPGSLLNDSLFRDDRLLAWSVATAYGRKVVDVMTPNPTAVGAEASLADAARLFFERGLKRLPVLDGDRLAGILSRSDFVRTLGRLGKEQASREASDTEITCDLHERLDRLLGTHSLEVRAESGRVRITGQIASSGHESLIRALAASTDGVRAVHLELTGGRSSSR